MNFQTLDAAYVVIADVLMKSVDGSWDLLHFGTTILANNCCDMETLHWRTAADKQYLAIEMQACFDVNSAAIWIRDELLRTTGQRIWGLTFTLYPSGKFKIDYDYTRPDWYTVADEQADMAAEQNKQSSNDVEALALRLNSLGASADVSKVAANPANAFFEQSLAWLRTQTIQLEHAWGLGSEAEWALDLNAGMLSLTFADGRVECLPIQIVGTFNTNNESFLWAWDHPSIPVQLRKAAEQLQRYGVEHGLESLTTRQIHCSETDAWIYTAAAANLNKAVGGYRGKSGNTWVYMCLFK